MDETVGFSITGLHISVTSLVDSPLAPREMSLRILRFSKIELSEHLQA